MAHSWTSVASLDHAAAFRALGILVMSDKGVEVRKGKQWQRWSVSNDGTLPGVADRAGPLVRAVNRGELEKIDPDHPILDSLGVLQIRHQLVDALKNGTRYRIDLTASVYGAVLHRGNEPEAVQMPPHFRTGDLKLAACMIRLGLPLARLEGTPPSSTIFLASPGYAIGGSEPVHGNLARQFRDLPRDSWAHPAPPFDVTMDAGLNRLRTLMNALWWRDRLHDYINGREQSLHITSPYGHRSILMPENTDGRTVDRCRRFLNIP